MASSGGGWRDSEEVRTLINALLRAAKHDFCVEQPSRDSCILLRPLHALLDAVWASAVRGRAEQEPIEPWQVGKLLDTAQTRHWTKQQKENGEWHEARQIFERFTAEDEGRSRQLLAVCESPEIAERIVREHNGGLSRGAGGEDTARIEWLQANLGLHYGLDLLYVVDGYEVTITHDANADRRFRGDDLRTAIDRARNRALGLIDAARSPSGPPQEAHDVP